MDYESEISLLRNKRKHVTLTIQEKLDIINLVESGSCSRQTIANRYGIGKSTVHDIHKRKDILKSFAMQNSTEVSKRRRVDTKLESIKSDQSFIYKEESNEIVEEETLVEHFEHEEFDYNNDEYEIVYESISCNNNEEMNTKPASVTPSKHDNENSAKRKSKTLTLKEKYDILKQLDEGKSVSAIINKYGIGRTTLYDLKKQKQKVFEYIENSSGRETRRTFKKSNYPEIENCLLDWCHSQNYFIEQEFFEKYKQLFVRLKSRKSNVQTPFNGSWSWCKRFFERHPELKKKITASSKHLNDSFKRERGIKSSDSEKFYSESDSINDDIIKNTPYKRNVNYLSISEKIQVLEEISAGKSISDLVTDFNISKSTVYDIIKKEDFIRQQHLNNKQQVIKSTQYSRIEKELKDWCLEQEILPNYSLITNKVLQIVKSMDIKEDFNLTTAWVKKFLEKHPELNKNLNDSAIKSRSSSICEIVETEQENSIEIADDDSLEFIESEFLRSEPKTTEIDEYGNDYIIEELDENNSDDFESQNYEDEHKVRPKDESLVTEEEALNSLKILIKYSEQKGHEEISRLLLEYQDIIEEENLL